MIVAVEKNKFYIF